MADKKKVLGFTLIELLVVIAIIGLLASIVLVSLNRARSKARYARSLTDMRQIGIAAEMQYDDNNNYAPDIIPGCCPTFVPTYLPQWPSPPCSNQVYDWENWVSGSNVAIRVTLRRSNWSPIYFYCIYTNLSDCWANGSPIQNLASKQLTCSE